MKIILYRFFWWIIYKKIKCNDDYVCKKCVVKTHKLPHLCIDLPMCDEPQSYFIKRNYKFWKRKIINVSMEEIIL